MFSRPQVVSLWITLSIGVPAAHLGAQSNQDAHLRNDCRLAAQVLRTGNPAPHRVWAMETIARCGDLGGPAVVATVWTEPPNDTGLLERLYSASYMLRDRRITEAAAGAARNGALPQIVRLNAIRVLAAHAEPRYMLSVADLTPVESETVRVTPPTVSHPVVREGEQPIGRETMDLIVATLTRLRDDPDARVARAATYIRKHVCHRVDCTSL